MYYMKENPVQHEESVVELNRNMYNIKNHAFVNMYNMKFQHV